MAGYAGRTSLPIGVAILSVFIGIFGAFLLVVGILLLLVAGLGASLGSAALFGISLLGGVILTIFAIVLLVVAYGLWHQELWALVLSILVVGGLFLAEVVRGAFFSLSGIILLVLLVYLIAVHRSFT